MWDSTQACRGANEVGSSILHLLRKMPITIRDVVIWSDSCGGQNRNQENAAMVLYFLNEEKKKHKIKSVTFKYFERGHNQSVVDTIHRITC